MTNYTDEEKYYIWLHCPYVISNKKITELINYFKSPKKVFEAFVNKNNLDICKILTDKEYKELNKYADEKYVHAFMERLEKSNVKVVCKYSANFPKKLKDLINLAGIDILYCKGNLNLLNKKSVAIVGTRKPDSYGIEVAEIFTKVIADAGVVIISGLASGIDATAHKTTLDLNKETIAVINGGFNHIYPAFNVGLSKIIEEKGLLLSEQPPQVKPLGFGFPIRNRVIAALSDAVFIPQMGKTSGAKHTFFYAVEYGKPAYLAPSDIFRVASEGNNILLDEYPLSLVCNPYNILTVLNVDAKKIEKEKVKDNLNEDEKIILNILKDDELHFDELTEKTGFAIKKLNRLLTTMTISGIIKGNAGNYYSKSHKN